MIKAGKIGVLIRLICRDPYYRDIDLRLSFLNM